MDYSQSTGFTVGRAVFQTLNAPFSLNEDYIGFARKYDLLCLWPRNDLPLVAPRTVHSPGSFSGISNDFCARIGGPPLAPRT